MRKEGAFRVTFALAGVTFVSKPIQDLERVKAWVKDVADVEGVITKYERWSWRVLDWEEIRL
jgi:hypothetical protein